MRVIDDIHERRRLHPRDSILYTIGAQERDLVASEKLKGSITCDKISRALKVPKVKKAKEKEVVAMEVDRVVVIAGEEVGLMDTGAT